MIDTETGKLLANNPAEKWFGFGGYHLWLSVCLFVFFLD